MDSLTRVRDQFLRGTGRPASGCRRGCGSRCDQPFCDAGCVTREEDTRRHLTSTGRQQDWRSRWSFVRASAKNTLPQPPYGTKQEEDERVVYLYMTRQGRQVQHVCRSRLIRQLLSVASCHSLLCSRSLIIAEIMSLTPVSLCPWLCLFLAASASSHSSWSKVRQPAFPVSLSCLTRCTTGGLQTENPDTQRTGRPATRRSAVSGRFQLHPQQHYDSPCVRDPEQPEGLQREFASDL